MSVVLWIVLPLLCAYEAALRWCWTLWWKPDYYFGHGPLVPLVMAAVIWRRRQTWRRTPAVPDLHAFWLLGPALFAHLVGAALTIDSMSAASLALAVPGAAWLGLGRQRLRGLWPVLWLFAFAVPLPLYVTGRLAFELKEIAVTGGVVLAGLTGLPVVREGPFLQVPGQDVPLDVADPCGGLRSLLAMVTLAYCVAFFLGPMQRRRLGWLLLLAGPIALIVNVLRIGAICWLARWQGVPFATGTGHDLMNALAWVLDLCLVFGVDALATAPGAAGRAAPPEIELGALQPARSLRGPGLLLWALCGPLLWLSEYRPHAESSGRAAALPATVGAFVQTQLHPLSLHYRELLGTDDATWRTYQLGDEVCYVVAVFHASNWKSVHPPHVCLLASDMDIEVDDEVDLGDGSGARVGRIECSTRKDHRRYLTLYAYGARDLCTSSYAAFFLHHAPRALFRASNDGFLLRVDAYGDGAGGTAAAEARCRELLALLLTEARRLLP